MTLETEGVTAEAPETTVEETEVDTNVDTSTETDSDEGTKEPEETVDSKLERLEREVAGKQKKIDRQTAANRKTLEQYEQQKQEHEKLTQLMEQNKPQTEPTIDDFETHDEYVNALVEFRAKGEVQKQQEQLMAQQQQYKAEQVAVERQRLRQTQEVEYMVDNPMYKAASNEVDTYIATLNVSNGTADAMIAQLYDGNVPAVIDYFGSNNGENLEELGNLARMTPPEAAVAIYKIQQKVSSSTVKKETKPKTIPVKAGKGGSASKKSLAQADGRGVLDWVNQ